LLGKAGIMPPVDLSAKTKRQPRKAEKPAEGAAAPAEAPAAAAAPPPPPEAKA